MSAFSAIGPKLVERGYSAVPIMPGSKRPGFGRTGLDDWQRFALRLPTEIELDHWSEQEAGVGVVAGGEHHIVAIDVDVDDAAIMAAIHSTLPSTPVVKAGQKGETLFFRGPGVISRSFNQYSASGVRGRRLVDIIAAGRQTVLPPSIHPDTGQPYRWIGGAALESIDPDDLPELPADIGDQLAAALSPFGYKPDPVRAPPMPHMGDGETPHRELNDAAMANLSAWVPALGLFKLKHANGGFRAVATWRPSNRGRPDEQRQPNLKIHPSGIRDFHDGDRAYTPLDLVMAARDCDLEDAFSFLSAALGRASDGVIDLDIKRSPPPPPPALRVKAEPQTDLTRVPGLLGEIVDWITDTSRRPNRMLALGAAITILGTLVGRRWSGPTRSGTHLYVLGLAPTGAGKDHPLTQITRLMKAAKASHHVGPDEFISMPAVINMMQRMPLSLCPMDEFGAFLKRINSRKASNFESGITKTLRSAWGKSFSTLHMPEWAGKMARAIEAPAMSIFGVSTPEEFYGSLEGGDVINGVLNRFLVLTSDSKVRDRDPLQDPRVVPDWLTDALAQTYEGGNPLITSRLNDISLDATPEVIDWADAMAKGIYADMLNELEIMTDRAPTVAPFIARSAEMAVRLATIRAVGISPNNRSVTADDIAWGRDLALLSAKTMAEDAADHITENDHQAMAQRVIRIVKGAGGRITHRELHRRMAHVMRATEMKNLLESMVKHSGVLVDFVVAREDGSGGHPTKWYQIAE